MSPSVAKRLADARRITDPLERTRVLHNEVLPALKELETAVMNERALAAAEANDAGTGYRKLSAEVGISTARAQQLVAEGRRVRAGEGRWQPKPQAANRNV